MSTTPPTSERSTTSRVLHVLLPLLALAGGAYWIFANARFGKFTVDPSAVTMVITTSPSDGAKNVLPNAYVSAGLNPGHAIDPATVSTNAIKLYRSRDHETVAADVNTSGSGDSIVLQPARMLEPQTKYTFEVTRELKDRTGQAVLPFTMTFTTSGEGEALTNFAVAFERVPIPGDQAFYTGLAVGPDHKLYAGTADGKIIRREIRPDGTVINPQLIKTVAANNNGPRLITGIAFDPIATPENPILWISHGQLVINQQGKVSMEGATEWTGKISRLSGPDLSEYKDVVINLPRSWRDHLNNQPAFGPDGALYFSQGSHTAMGAPDQKWSFRKERLLSAAILRVDVKRIMGTLDAKTRDDGGSYDPFASDAPLTIYASGVRVGYDVLFHSNGYLYTAINGSSSGGNTPATPEGTFPKRIDEDRYGPYSGGPVVALHGMPEVQDDLMFRLSPGGYYGQPNPIRGEYVLNGGNPTPAKDPYEVSAYPVGTKPDRNWRVNDIVYNFGKSASPNGLVEYKSNTFGGALRGKILVTRFSGGKDIMILTPGVNGAINETISGVGGLTNFTDPLDIVEDTTTGCLYIAEFKGERLALLRPITDPTKAAAASRNVFRQTLSAN